FARAPDVNDPWSSAQSSPEHRRVFAHRRKMAEELDRAGVVPPDMETREIWLLYQTEDDYQEKTEPNEEQLGNREAAASLFNVKGLVALALRRHDEALAAAKEAVRLDPDNAVLHANLGINLLECGSGSEAEAAFRHALSLDASLIYAYEWLGYAYRKRGDEAAAIPEY